MELFEFNNKINLVESTSNKTITNFINQISENHKAAYLTKYAGNYTNDTYEFFLLSAFYKIYIKT